MAPVGCRESLAAALRAGADSIYFGVEELNMRAHSAQKFTIDDLRDIARECQLCGVKTYLTLNTIVYDEDLATMRRILDAAHEAGITAVIAADVSAMTYARSIGMPVHLSTQLNISNIEALRFYAQFADVVVLARELCIEQVEAIHRRIISERITGPSGQLIRIEMFCHGALCMAVSGKCYLSLHTHGRSANRGECMQVCRRAYQLADPETGIALGSEAHYFLSPKDLKTINFLPRLLEAGVEVLKIEGRARGAEYVDAVVRAYKEAVEAYEAGTFRPGQWDEQLSRVCNRGYWDGHYQGRTATQWLSLTDAPGSQATEAKVYCARVEHYFPRLGVAEVSVQACPLSVGDEVVVTGPTTGFQRFRVEELRYDTDPIPTAQQGRRASLPVPCKVRPADKLFVLRPRG